MVLVVLLLSALGLYMSYEAPCGMYAGVPLKDVPLRCLPGGDR